MNDEYVQKPSQMYSPYRSLRSAVFIQQTDKKTTEAKTAIQRLQLQLKEKLEKADKGQLYSLIMLNKTSTGSYS